MPRPVAKKTTAPGTYREAYAVLARIAAELETGEADLDRVLPLVQEAQAAYEVCRERIEALREALSEGAAADDGNAGDGQADDGDADDE